MTDREMLELAAKAIGGSYWHDARTFSDYFVIEQDEPVKWNPLTDDGDALRLATRLHIDLEFYKACVEAIWIDEALSETHTVVEYCDEEIDGWPAKEAATCRAIVRAAAEIGKGMAAQPSGKDLPEDDYYKSQAEAFYGGNP